MRITVFGANGPTGRLLTDQALAVGHQVAAVTRQPESFPLHHDRLEVVGADVLDPVAVDNPTLLQWIRREAAAKS
jgi:uncharacterized protein YbjT (DUF2867 family)